MELRFLECDTIHNLLVIDFFSVNISVYFRTPNEATVLQEKTHQ